jgi:hypothetical protein
MQQSKKLQRMEEEMTAVFNEKVKAQEEKLKRCVFPTFVIGARCFVQRPLDSTRPYPYSEEDDLLNEHDILKRELEQERAYVETLVSPISLSLGVPRRTLLPFSSMTVSIHFYLRKIREQRDELERERQEFEARRGEDDKKKKGRFGLHG